MHSYIHSISLQTILIFDAITCLFMAVLLTYVSGVIAGLTGISASILFWAGIVLLPVAVIMWALSRASAVPTWGRYLVVGGNLLWILATLLLPAFGMISPNILGWAFLLVQAAVVAVFTWFEWASVQRPASRARSWST